MDKDGQTALFWAATGINVYENCFITILTATRQGWTNTVCGFQKRSHRCNEFQNCFILASYCGQ